MEKNSAILLVVFTCVVLTQLAYSTSFTICIPLSIGRTKPALHAYYSVEYFAARQSYPGVTFRAAMIGNNGGDSTSVRDAVGAWVRDGVGSCDAVIGPSRSSVSTALSPLIRVPWMSWGSTSTALSDKASHPSFSRAVPTDDVGGGGLAVLMVRRFGWQRASVVFVDDSYGRSVASGVATRMRELGGSISLSLAISTVNSDESVDNALSAIERVKTRIIVVAGVAGSDGFNAILRGFDRRNMPAQGYVAIFSESACVTTPPAFLQVTGSFCMPYIVEDARMAPFTAFYENDVSESAKRAVLRTTGMRDDLMEVSGTDILSAFAHEATQHVMAALNATKTEGVTFEARVSALRSIETSGVTGTVSLDENGDRISVSMQVLNAQPDGSSLWLATVEGEVVLDQQLADGQQLYFPGVGFTNSAPSDTIGSADDSEDDVPTFVVLGVVSAINLLSLLTVAVCKIKGMQPKQRVRVVSSRLWMIGAKIIFHVGDIVTDIISTYVVVSRPTGSTLFKSLYAGLVGLGVIASTRELLAVIRYFLDYLDGKKLTSSRVRFHEEQVARTESLSFVMEDLPMLIMTTVAINDSFDTFLLVSVFLTATVTGMKTVSIREMIASYLAPDPITEALIKRRESLLTESTLAKSANSQEVAQRHAEWAIEKRMEQLEQFAKRFAFELEDEGITNVEGLSIVMPSVSAALVNANGESISELPFPSRELSRDDAGKAGGAAVVKTKEQTIVVSPPEAEGDDAKNPLERSISVEDLA